LILFSLRQSTGRQQHALLGFLFAYLLLLSGCASYQPPTAQSQPALTLSSTLFNFKTVVLGQTLTDTLHVSNSGGAPLRITGLSLSDKQFVISGPSVPRVVLPNMSLDYSLSFTPSVAGNVSAALKISSNAVNTVASVSLSGSGQKVLATAQVSPASINFGTLTVQSTTTKNVTLQNSGDVNITLSGITVVGAGFGFTNLSPGYSLAPNQSVTFQVWFRPTAKGSASGKLSILSANLATPPVITLAGDGASSTSSPTPPPAPTPVQHTVHLSWEGSSSPVAGYHIYRSEFTKGGFQLISSSLVSATDYDDATVDSGTTYYYAVTTVADSGAESAHSNEATAVVPTP
jgi:hypothetical protein